MNGGADRVVGNPVWGVRSALGSSLHGDPTTGEGLNGLVAPVATSQLLLLLFLPLFFPIPSCAFFRPQVQSWVNHTPQSLAHSHCWFEQGPSLVLYICFPWFSSHFYTLVSPTVLGTHLVFGICSGECIFPCEIGRVLGCVLISWLSLCSRASLLKVWSSAQQYQLEIIRNTESQALPHTCWIRLCVSTRY